MEKLGSRTLRMQSEWQPHQGTWLCLPYRADNWREGASPAIVAFLQVARCIAKYEPVFVGVSEAVVSQFSHLWKDIEVGSSTSFPLTFVPLEYDDCWMRDIGPTFVFDIATKALVGIDWGFNAWGQKYSCWDRDAKVAERIISYHNAERLTADFVLEGGSIHVDDDGTVLVTEQCLLNPNRNPQLSKEDIEIRLKYYLGVSKVIWLPYGLEEDEDTDGHIDNFSCFTRSGQVLLSWTDDEKDNNYGRCRIALDILQKETDARGQSIEVVKIPLPPPMYYTAEQCLTLTAADGYQRRPGDRLAGSYVNFYIANGAIISPSFHPETDEISKAILQRCFPDRVIEQIPGLEVLLGGGNIHCITQQVPHS